MKIAIEPAGPVDLDVAVPGSKSVTNRAILAAALAVGTTRLTNASFSDDSRLLAQAMNAAGVTVETFEGERAMGVHGRGGEVPAASGEFFMGNAGTALRFLTSFACLGKGRYVIDGDGRMRERPIGGLVDALRQLGAGISYAGREGYPPLVVEGKGLRGGACRVQGGTSSQFVSSLLLSAPAASGDVSIEVAGEVTSKPYIDITLDVMRELGVEPERRGHERFVVRAGSRYAARELAVAGDGASAGYFLAMAAATGGRAVARGVGARTRQGELRFAGVLRAMGCAVTVGEDSIEVQGGPLRGVDVDMNDMPDSAQTLAALALFAKGPTRVRNVRNLRVKETDRIAAIRVECGKLGARVEEHEDGFTLTPPARVGAAEIDTYQDHRMAMSFSVAAAAAPGIVIRDPECVSKSFPGYFELLRRLGLRVDEIDGRFR
jgi:3-phosphoshikimate 1-carboxyvinyltransferase